MTLSALIRKRDTRSLATATPAISATQPERETGTVAKIAAVAVANSTEGKAAPATEADAGDTAFAFPWWLLHYPDRNPWELACGPDANHTAILERHPAAVAAEPVTPTIHPPSAPLTAKQGTAIRAWLALIEETDPVTITEVIGQCQRDADAREYFTGRATVELPKPDRFPDDRRTCDQCANLIARRCHAAKRGEIMASRSYEPIRDLLRRCEAYAPGTDDPDRRHGRERWPGLIQN